MSTRQAWRLFAQDSPVVSTLLIAGVCFNGLVCLALLVAGRFGDAIHPFGSVMLFCWIVLLEVELTQTRAVITGRRPR